MGRRTVRVAPVLLACLLLIPAIRARAQAFQTQDPGAGFVKVTGKWQFHTGDNPAWANPAYDDSTWEQLSTDKSWGAQTHPGYTGFAWYRKQITVNASGNRADPAQAVAIRIPPVDDVYELYWNGRKIGSVGSMPPHAAWWMNAPDVSYALGTAPVKGVLALRVWKAPLFSNDPSTHGGMWPSPSLGNPSIFAMRSALHWSQVGHRLLPQFLIAAVVFVSGMIALLLFGLDRRQWLYLWLAIYLLTTGLLTFVPVLVLRDYGLHFAPYVLIETFVTTLRDISLWLLLLTLFRFNRERRWRRCTVVLAILYITAQVVDIATIYNWQHAGLGMQWTDAITSAIYTLTPLYILFIVGFGLARRKEKSLWPLAITAFLYGLWNSLLDITGQGVRFTHWTIYNRIFAWRLNLGGYGFDANFLLDTALFLVLVFTVARQQFLERRRQMRIDTEIQSAREVQHVLIPEDVPAIPGFAIASIYKPATELGGDFYQVIPLEKGGGLVVVGDVSGKGLRAAMIVSLIVGTLRTLADYTQEPAEILRGLNRRLIGRTQGGFATCLVMRIEGNGNAALATAGHFAPFRDGKELPLDGSLPLGLTPDADYEEIVFRLHENETLTFYTDGIVEARNHQGELFGFDRVREMARAGSSAVEIAEQASVFGQEDDITVLTLTRLAASEPAHAATVKLATQIAAI